MFIVSAAICAAAIGDLIGKGHITKVNTVLAYATGGASVMILMMSSLFYANVTNSTGAGFEAVAVISIWFYVGSVLAGAASIMLGEL